MMHNLFIVVSVNTKSGDVYVTRTLLTDPEAHAEKSAYDRKFPNHKTKIIQIYLNEGQFEDWKDMLPKAHY